MTLECNVVYDIITNVSNIFFLGNDNTWMERCV